MSKSIPKIYALRPLRAICILDYLLYLEQDDLCNEVEAKKDWITHGEWMVTQMWVKSKLRSKLPEVMSKLKKMYQEERRERPVPVWA